MIRILHWMSWRTGQFSHWLNRLAWRLEARS